jgi:hypothetical protein
MPILRFIKKGYGVWCEKHNNPCKFGDSLATGCLPHAANDCAFSCGGNFLLQVIFKFKVHPVIIPALIVKTTP